MDQQLTDGTGLIFEQHPTGNEMDQSLPPSTSTSRPGTPQLSNCQRLKEVIYEIRQNTVLIELQKTTINTLQLQGLNDDVIMATLLQRLPELQGKHQNAVSEFSSLPGCDNPGCENTFHSKLLPQ
ncbi:hypothetical protein TNIN_394641 [Trichonephila inaurata madagascariensis]|uniref:Uncharacterized protein n=1 Tax=Trichonephila inaurata madagascariensis TaxID=2747483 RepID=A0A8X6YDA4_9ARAC|nr:hypothetical protein TNIN_394641 [Trichonephila inaurata madagascariensis]